MRYQVGAVIVAATMLEYTASPLLGLYTYRLHNVPSFVPPGHGLGLPGRADGRPGRC